LNAAAARMLAQAKRATGIDFSQKGLQLPS
jgi:hypothetical protein